MQLPGDTMENTLQVQTENVSRSDSLLVASLILMDATRTIRGVQVITAVLLRYAMTGVCLTNCLMEWIVPTTAEQN